MVKVRELIKVRAAVIKVYDECKAFFEFCIRKKKILVHENVLSFAIRNDVFFLEKKTSECTLSVCVSTFVMIHSQNVWLNFQCLAVNTEQ